MGVVKEDYRRGSRRGKVTAKPKEMSVEDMVMEERESGVSHNEITARNISRLGSRFKNTDNLTSRSGFDEDDEIDVKLHTSAETRMTDEQRKEHEKSIAMNAQRKWLGMQLKSPFSVDNPRFKKHLVVARGDHTYVILRTGKNAICEHHCCIVPIRQYTSIRACPEEVWEEVRVFQAKLRRACGLLGRSILFLECAVHLSRNWAHLEALPVPLPADQDANLFFKQALLQCEGDWGSHRKIMEVTPLRGMRRVIPEKGFPYFYVEWTGGGYVHIIEEEDTFDTSFGRKVVAGMLDDGDSTGIRPNLGQNLGNMREGELTARFLRDFDAGDWTTKENDIRGWLGDSMRQ